MITRTHGNTVGTWHHELTRSDQRSDHFPRLWLSSSFMAVPQLPLRLKLQWHWLMHLESRYLELQFPSLIKLSPLPHFRLTSIQQSTDTFAQNAQQISNTRPSPNQNHLHDTASLTTSLISYTLYIKQRTNLVTDRIGITSINHFTTLTPIIKRSNQYVTSCSLF